MVKTKFLQKTLNFVKINLIFFYFLLLFLIVQVSFASRTKQALSSNCLGTIIADKTVLFISVGKGSFLNSRANTKITISDFINEKIATNYCFNNN